MIPIPEAPTMRDASDLGRGLKNNLVERGQIMRIMNNVQERPREKDSHTVPVPSPLLSGSQSHLSDTSQRHLVSLPVWWQTR